MTTMIDAVLSGKKRSRSTSPEDTGSSLPESKRQRLSTVAAAEDELDIDALVELVLREVADDDSYADTFVRVGKETLLQEVLKTTADCILPHTTARRAVMQIPAKSEGRHHQIPVCAECFKLCFYPSKELPTTIPKFETATEFVEQLITVGRAFTVENLFGLVKGKSTREDIRDTVRKGKGALTAFSQFTKRVAPTLESLRCKRYGLLSSDIKAMNKSIM